MKYPLKTVQLGYNKIVIESQTFVLNASKTNIEEVISNESENDNATAHVRPKPDCKKSHLILISWYIDSIGRLKRNQQLKTELSQFDIIGLEKLGLQGFMMLKIFHMDIKTYQSPAYKFHS